MTRKLYDHRRSSLLLIVPILLSGCFGGTLKFTGTDASSASTSAKTSTISTSTTSVVADGVSTATITITLKDSSSNPVIGKTVTLSSTRSTSDKIDPSSEISDSNGVVTFLVSSTSIGSSTLKAKTSDSVSLSSTVSVTFTASLFISGGGTEPYNFGTYGVGTVASHSFTVTNNGLSKVTGISASTLANPFAFKGGSYPGFGGTCGTSVLPGSSCTLVMTYTGTVSPSFTHSATMSLTYSNSVSQSSSTTMSGKGTTSAVLAITDHDPSYYSNFNIPTDGATFDYGTIGVGTPTDHVFSVTNNGGTAATAIADPATLSGAYSYKGGSYPGTGGTCGATLAKDATCRLVVTFTPPSASTLTATLTLNHASGSATRPLTGKGTSSAFLTVFDHNDNGSGINESAVYDFQTHGLLTSTDHTFYVFNSGAGIATGLSAGAISSSFSFKNGLFPGGIAGMPASEGDGNYCSSSLSPNTMCAVTVTFTPTSTGASAGSFAVAYNAGTASRSVRGSGTSVALLSINPFHGGGGPSSFYDYGYQSSTLTRGKTFLISNEGGASATGVSDASSLSAPFEFPGGYPGGSGTFDGYPYCDPTTSLPPRSGCLVQVDLVNPAGMSTGTIGVNYSDGAGSTSTTNLGLRGIGTALAIVSVDECPNGCNHGGGPNQFDLGSFGILVDQVLYVHNDGDSSTSFTDLGGWNSGFSYTSASFPGGAGSIAGTPYCSTPLSAHSTCAISVRYTPSGTSPVTDTHTWTLGGATSATTSISLRAKPTTRAVLVVSEHPGILSCGDRCGPFDFGNVLPPSSASTYLYVTNVGGQNATNISVNLGSPPHFHYYGGSYPGSGGTCGTTLLAGASCTVKVEFTPGTSGYFFGEISITPTDSEGSLFPAHRSLMGMGTGL